MKVSELKSIIDRQLELHPDRGDCEVVITLAMPSMGPVASTNVSSAYFGIDWDGNHLLLEPKDHLSIKTDNESIYDVARDLLGYLATKPGKRQSYETKTALRVFERLNYDIMKYQHIFHHDVKRKEEKKDET